MVIVIGNTKGGVGKSTIACNLATNLSLLGKDVCLIDVDRQKTSSIYVGSRDKGKPHITCIQLRGDVLDQINEMKHKYDQIIIDAGGYDSVELRTSMLAADKLIIPIKASQIDLWAAEDDGGINDLVGKAKSFNRDLKAYCLLSMTPTHAMISEKSDARNFLSDFSNIDEVLNSFISERKVYRDSFLEGLGAVEMSNDKALREIKKLTTEIYGEL